MITQEQISAVSQMLDGKKNIVIFTHMSPDGDAMGSANGLKTWLKQNTIQPSVTVITPNPYPPFLGWLPFANETLICDLQPTECQAAVDAADLIFCLDFNCPKRIGSAADLLTNATCPKILIDHHTEPDTQMADIIISYTAAPATCYLVLDLLNGLNSSISLECATCLYTGLMTDTGNFAYNSNNAELYEMIAQLMRAGINKDAIYDAVFNQYTSDRMELMGYILFRKMKINKKQHIALLTLTSAECRRFNFQKGDAEGFVNLPLQIADVYYSIFMREDGEKIRISFRSQGDRPVNLYAQEFFNGGGHKNAAGGESYLTMDATIKRFENTFPDWFRLHDPSNK